MGVVQTLEIQNCFYTHPFASKAKLKSNALEKPKNMKDLAASGILPKRNPFCQKEISPPTFERMRHPHNKIEKRKTVS
ncbi:hypothetical protein ACTXT7_016965 [Hymenolepis weldensis]